MKRLNAFLALFVVFTVVFLCSCGAKKQKSTESAESSAYSASADGNDSNDVSAPDFSVNSIKAYTNVSANNVEADLPEMSFGDIKPYVASDASALSKAEQEEIVRKHKDLLAKLDAAFKSYNINVNINQATGEAALDSSVLFGGDSAELTGSGKSFLKSFINAYSSVLLDKDFDGFIAKVYVEGHTAPVGENSYEKGLPLSKERADVVLNYCLSDECGLSDGSVSALKKIMEAKGFSDAFPVKDKNGNVDMEASRRVNFKFVINI